MFRLLTLLGALALLPALMAQTVTVSDLGAQVPAGNVSQGQTDYIALGFGMTRGLGDPATNFTGCTISNTNTSSPAGMSDTVRIRLIRDTDQNGSIGGTDVVLDTVTSPSFPVTFSGFSEAVSTVATPSQIYPMLVVIDVENAATVGNIYNLQLDSITLSAGSSTGTPISGNDQTIVAPSNAEIAIERNSVNIDSGTTDTVGNRQTGVQFTLTYTILNTGSQALNLTGSPRVDIPSISVQNCTATVTSQPPAQIAAMSSATFTVDVTPGTSGQAFGFGMLIVNNDSDESQFTIAVGGDSVASAGGATQLVITTQPAGAVANSPFVTQPVVEARDASNQLVTSFTGTVTATIQTNPGSGSLIGTVMVSAVNGEATFNNLGLDTAGTGYVLRFSSTPLTPADSNAFDVTGPVGPATQLVVTTQPGGAAPGVALTQQPVVQIQDASGQLVTTDNSTQVTVSITPGSGAMGAVLGGTTTVTAAGGVVTFAGLSIDLAGTGYTLEFDDGGSLTDATSNTFDVTIGGSSGGGGGGGDDDEGCSTGGSNGWIMLAALLAAVTLATRLSTRES